ncbi:MAG: DEAD/DEAH box helicase [Candidatus Tectomicrobia bacterium]|uniref:DEAD/DEAH box helicase n=1 Tax=Tectimicrobiota bacterium TaxID=2528274 RepID=A0A933LPQ6_UNCTE|nr:DEAD/DEAH box helicase [Candidatus Tectomicrobia bacterium]
MSQNDQKDTESRWIILHGSLSIERNDGTVFVPSAKDIFAAEFHDNLRINNVALSNKPSVDISLLRISKYPLDLRVEVRPPKADISQSMCRIVAKKGNTSITIPGFSKSIQDHVLVEKHWYPLDAGEIEEISTLLANAGITEPGQLSLKQYLYLVKSQSDLVFVNEGMEEAQPDRQSRNEVDERLPGFFTGQLYPYQINGYRWLRMIAREDLGCILADEMGLGKTIQIIALLADERENERGPSLVIAPTTILENWRREIVKFSTLKCTVHRGSERTGFPSQLKEYDLIITSYETAVRDLPLLKMISWDVVVLDEAQAIKNPGAQRTATAKEISRRVSVAVTGTPLENHLTDMWSIMDFSIAGLLGNLQEFEKRYADNVSGAAALEPVVSPVMLRRKVQDVAGDLPTKIVIPQPVELDEVASEAYEILRQESAARIGKGVSLASLVKLRMFCTHPFLVQSSSGTDDPSLYSTKYVRLLEILEEFIAKFEKTLIFTSFTQMVDILAQDIVRRYRIYCDFIDGRVDVRDRQKIVDAFSLYKGPAVLVLNPRAAGTGLNIFAANHVIHYNTEWNPAVEDQASARAYRRGQTRPVTIHRLFHTNTIEEVMNMRMERKRALTGHAVVGHDGTVNDLDDILRAMEISPVLNREQKHE